jgi:hypothetical protein
MRVLPFAVVWVAAFAVVSAQSGAPVPRAVAAVRPQTTAALPVADPSFVKQYCLTCHNERTKVGGLVLDPAGSITSAPTPKCGKRWCARSRRG